MKGFGIKLVCVFGLFAIVLVGKTLVAACSVECGEEIIHVYPTPGKKSGQGTKYSLNHADFMLGGGFGPGLTDTGIPMTTEECTVCFAGCDGDGIHMAPAILSTCYDCADGPSKNRRICGTADPYYQQ